MKANNEWVTVLLTHDQCVDNRDALSKTIYSALFDHIVDRVVPHWAIVTACGRLCQGLGT